jgi:hypothetical protein
MKMKVFWEVVLCSLINLNDASEMLTAYINRQMKAVSTFDTSTNCYQTTTATLRR